MSMSTGAKLALSGGIGVASTLLTDGALRYWADRNPANAVADANGVKPQNWYYKYSSLLGAGVSVAAAGVLWKTLGKGGGARVPRRRRRHRASPSRPASGSTRRASRPRPRRLRPPARRSGGSASFAQAV